jgi:NADH-quinone oxidoreductase subunit A
MNSNTVLLPFLIYAALVILIVSLMIILSYVLGERHKEKMTDEPFESGIEPTESARLRFNSHFYLIAMFFVIFDLDAAFIVTWTITFRELGLAGYIGVSIFIFILVAVLIYELGIGALDFGPNGKKIIKAMKKRIEN